LPRDLGRKEKITTERIPFMSIASMASVAFVRDFDNSRITGARGPAAVVNMSAHPAAVRQNHFPVII